jgi:hypothetical protein
MASFTQKAALLIIAEACDKAGVTWRGLQDLAAGAGVDYWQLRRHVAALERLGLLVRYRRWRLNGSRTSDLLVLCMPREQDLALSGYDGRGGMAVGIRTTSTTPPEQARIVEDLGDQSRILAEEPSCANGVEPSCANSQGHTKQSVEQLDPREPYESPPQSNNHRSSSAGAGAGAGASDGEPTTTDVIQNRDVEDGGGGDPDAVLDFYRELCEDVPNSPRPRASDRDAAKTLAQIAFENDDESGILAILEWATEDDYTRQRLRTRGLRLIADNLEGILQRASGDPDRPVYECLDCGCHYSGWRHDGHGIEIDQTAGFCPRCWHEHRRAA